MSVRAGVVGVAGMGMFHVTTIPKIETYELTAICDVVPDALDRALANAPAGVSRFTDPSELFTSGAVDAVVVATPNAMHAGHVASALEAGLHVYCEKPLGMTVTECREIERAADERGLRVQVGFQHRFQHQYATAHALVERGEIGRIHRANLFATDWFRPSSYFEQRTWRKRWAVAGGGVLMVQAIHQLDAFLWTVGMPSRVTARAWSTRPGVEVEDDVSALLDFASGARGVLVATTVDPAGANRIELHGELGSIVAHGERLRLGKTPRPVPQIIAEEENPFARVPVTWTDVDPQGAATTFEDCVIACHRDFVDAIETARPPLNRPSEASRSVEVANAVYLSAVTGRPVDLPLDGDAYADAFAKLCSGELSLPSPEPARL